MRCKQGFNGSKPSKATRKPMGEQYCLFSSDPRASQASPVDCGRFVPSPDLSTGLSAIAMQLVRPRRMADACDVPPRAMFSGGRGGCRWQRARGDYEPVNHPPWYAALLVDEMWDWFGRG